MLSRFIHNELFVQRMCVCVYVCFMSKKRINPIHVNVLDVMPGCAKSFLLSNKTTEI